MTDALPVLQVGLDHRSAPPDLLGPAQAAAAGASLAPILAAGLSGAVAIVTCHRAELYVEGPDVLDGCELFERWLGRPVPAQTLRCREGTEAGRHLLRVAAGVESAVLGEDQILGQLRAAYRAACASHSPGPLLHRLFHAAFRAGKRARNETPIQRGNRSLAGCAVGELKRQLGGLSGRSILVLGAGKMGRLAAARLVRRGASPVVIANRSFDRAQNAARSLGITAVPWSWRKAALMRADAVLAATAAPEPVLGPDDFLRAMEERSRPLVAVDLSMPRNLETPDGPPHGLVVADVASLAQRLEGQRRQRRHAIEQVERIVEEELSLWTGWAALRPPLAVGRKEALHGR